jgi:hypothetical protein
MESCSLHCDSEVATYLHISLSHPRTHTITSIYMLLTQGFAIMVESVGKDEVVLDYLLAASSVLTV